MRKTLLGIFLLASAFAWSQNPATIFSIPNKNITLPCGVTCTQVTATVPHIKETNDYIVTPMPYLPFAYTTPTGNEVTDIYIDDRWSNVITPGFPFCFYNQTYNGLLMGSNANITFNTALANSGSGYAISATTGAIPNTAYAIASIFGPYHDINPNLTTSPTRKIEWRIEGTAPARRFIASYNQIPYFSSSCDAFFATHQIVLYESTGVIEVYIQDKPFCTSWNTGLSILGIQDETRTRAVAVPGYNATQWGSTGMNEAYRFTPNGGVPRFKKAELLQNGSVVATADTASGAIGHLDLTFPTVCPVLDSNLYILRVTYGKCNNPAEDVWYDDTVYVRKTTPQVAVSSTVATCTAGGSISANVTGGVGTIRYSLNGGVYQTGNSFTNLAPGNYTISVQDSLNCTFTYGVNIPLNNNLFVNAMPDTSVCFGGSFTARVTSNASSFDWSPGIGLSSTTAMQPTVTVNGTTTYVVTASQGPCLARDTFNVTMLPPPQVNAGPDLTIISGDVIQLQATAIAGSTYSWSPSTALSATNILNPFANPDVTTTYTLSVTTPDGCIGSDAMTITVLECIEPMEAFTPNGDGINDLWLITQNNCLRTARVQVYNRYGNLVFESQDYRNNWNGTYNGKPVPDGTYYFVISYQLINNKTIYKKGNVTILR
ncbi:MAG TPA: gliding motility-associated C-terminal domain-containing protein [Flavisolibacter sp.]